jgi:serine/threonine-protein kinase
MTPRPTESDALFLDFQEGVAGRYSIDRELGRGGMGVVYLAREVHLDRLVAIKLLPPTLAARTDLRERFLREARLAAKLTHPHIVPIHAVEESGAFVFYVMAYVEGETLADRVERRGPLPATEAARVLREVAWALAFAHAQGFVHRDIKPDNILLESSTGRALVADFGIAAAMGDGIEDRIVGTPEFMSPEQVLGKALDARSDLYALGATAFYALSGRLPFRGESPTEVMARQVNDTVPSLASTGVSVPRKLAALVDRCLAKDPAQRPATAHVLGEQLNAASDHRRELPVALRAFVRRNSRLDGAGTLFAGLGLLIASSVASTKAGAAWGGATFLYGAILLPATYFITAARRLAELGFAHQDLAPAFASEMERAREELQVAHAGARPTIVERILGGTAFLSALVVGLLAPVVIFLDSGVVADLFAPFFLAGVSATLTGVGWLALTQRRRDLDTTFWSKLWTGPIGRGLFGIARRTLGRVVPANAVTHRATELSLGLAAVELFDGLPRATRETLGDVPAVLRRLQEDARVLRSRHDDVAHALDAAGEASAGERYESVRTTRDELRARLTDTVSAMETIRLQLLRLHAGAVTPQGVTTHIGLAIDVSEQVSRLIAAQDEVDRSLAERPSSSPARRQELAVTPTSAW